MIFSRILNYLLGNINEDTTSITFKKAKTLSIVLMVISVLVCILIVKVYIVEGFERIEISFYTLVLILSMLFIIRKGKPLLAGNILSSALVILMIYSMITNSEEANIPYFMVGTYYVFFALILFAAMFASRTTLTLCTIAIIASSSYIYFANIELIPENVEKISASGYFLYQIIIAICYVLSLIFTNFINAAIKGLSEKSEIIEAQNTNMYKAAEKIKDSSEELLQSSMQLSSVSQLISQSSSEQAATTEEVSAAMQQMIGNILANTENAENMQEKTVSASTNLKESSKVFLQTIELVNEITKKTEIITKIAHQTNMLALNASVEAARAGKKGKGFTVVANEVKSLAERSQMASAEIEELSKSGFVVSQKAQEALEKSLFEIAGNSDLMKEIAMASQEQKAGSIMVNNSIQQLTKITNQNSASAEEMSASAEQLSAQAEQLKEIIVTFNKT